ncbi:MAG: hypothetical protein H5U33_21850, partial [Pseudomonas sp.]|nr:hypothetical protein [Pseudomonas sp.]
MSGGLFDRWFAAPVPAQTPEVTPAIGLQLWLDDQARVLRLNGGVETVTINVDDL